MESYDRVSFQVAHVHGFAKSDDVWVLSYHQPSHMGEEEALVDVVRVGVGICEFVVGPVVTAPLEDAILESYSLKDAQNDSEREFGLVGFVAP